MDPTAVSLQRFWSRLASALEAGESLLAALGEARGVCDCPEASEAVAAVAQMVADGAMLSEALAAQPAFFGPGVVHIIRGGEYLGLVERAARFIADASEQCPSCAGWQGDHA